MARGRRRISAEMDAYTRSQTRGGARKNVGRIERISCGSLLRLSEKHTEAPCTIGSNSATIRWAIWAEGRKAMVESSGESGSTVGPIWILATRARWAAKPIFGSPVAPEVIYNTAGSEASN